jgi:uncharacterized protein (DUF1330 family)
MQLKRKAVCPKASRRREDSVSAYVVFVRERLKDPELYKEYSAKARPAGAGHPLQPLAYYGEIETLEGDAAEGVVILRFPNVEAARAWYHSEGYQEAKAIRERAADCRAFLTQGLD